jgi:hypothetical protein
MISLTLARQLKQAGLLWQASTNDFFAIPDRGMDERVFVISDLMSNLDIFRGWPVVTFHGTAEWALDYILTTEVVWLPTEEQLRKALIDKLSSQLQLSIVLSFAKNNYCCTIIVGGQEREFESPVAGDAYGLALLYMLEQEHTNNHE